MADVDLTVLIEKANGTQSGVMTIDRIEVVFRNNRGQVTVDGTAAEHKYRYWFAGPSGGTFSYEIKRGDDAVLKKKTRTIDPGEHYNAGYGKFKLT